MNNRNFDGKIIKIAIEEGCKTIREFADFLRHYDMNELNSVRTYGGSYALTVR